MAPSLETQFSNISNNSQCDSNAPEWLEAKVFESLLQKHVTDYDKILKMTGKSDKEEKHCFVWRLSIQVQLKGIYCI